MTGYGFRAHSNSKAEHAFWLGPYSNSNVAVPPSKRAVFVRPERTPGDPRVPAGVLSEIMS